MTDLAHSPSVEAPSAARIGPNAIIRVAEALREQCGEAATVRLFEAAGLREVLANLPTEMVDERAVAALHQAVRRELTPALAQRLARAAGDKTGAYLLAYRIPRPVQTLLHWLPAPLAARVLLAAIGRNAWTFVGSGRFSARAGTPVRLTIVANPLIRGERAPQPICDYYAATFECLFRALVSPRARVVETECEATGAAACVFEVRWDGVIAARPCNTVSNEQSLQGVEP